MDYRCFDAEASRMFTINGQSLHTVDVGGTRVPNSLRILRNIIPELACHRSGVGIQPGLVDECVLRILHTLEEGR